MAQSLTHTKAKLVGADAIYDTNANRRFASSNNIRTDFVRKGRAGKHEQQRKQLAAQIKKERATRQEGSFGKDKKHYYLSKIKARTKDTEILWIFMGIHVGNALEIGRRMQKQAIKAA
ncbi:transposase [Carboxylicivirga linearis]|uniref:Transposase n=1 Tax=Carboxylicivirga linearis TaxID=1628157 RepID=A0ABS5K0J3_9BACT|nr:transposase [Carboxylicivirga linearis]MBS2100595.1 transposase [Carboxylicivirga linearis]